MAVTFDINNISKWITIVAAIAACAGVYYKANAGEKRLDRLEARERLVEQEVSEVKTAVAVTNTEVGHVKKQVEKNGEALRRIEDKIDSQ